jgi:DNA uptake protein ComE-like DNA-binding protein
VGAILGVGGTTEAEREEEAEEAEEAEEEEVEAAGPEVPAPTVKPPTPEPGPVAAGDRTEINRATFEQLRDLGFSVTQATRVLTYRERRDGFDTLDDLDEVPGLPREFLREVKPRLTV